MTLIGPGGVGKTRLALEVVRTLEPSFPHGACWVELAGVSRPDEVGSTVARALRVTPAPGENTRSALLRFLANKRLLLAIDNFEHVLGAAKLAVELHTACRGLALLLTSREALNLSAEQVVPVAPLAVPAIDGTASVTEIESTPGSALFLAAARRRGEHFAIDATSAPMIAQICNRLEGLPLALELAAARTGSLWVTGSPQSSSTQLRTWASARATLRRDNSPSLQRSSGATASLTSTSRLPSGGSPCSPVARHLARQKPSRAPRLRPWRLSPPRAWSSGAANAMEQLGCRCSRRSGNTR